MFRSYKYKLEPNKACAQKIKETIYYVNELRRYVIDHGGLVQEIRCNAKEVLNNYIKDNIHLKEYDYSALINTLFNMIDDKNGRYEENRHSYTTTYSDYLALNYPIREDKIFLPRIGYVKFRKHRAFPDNGRIMKITVLRNHDDFEIIILFMIKDMPIKKELDKNNSIGVDYSSPHFMIDSNGLKYDIPAFYRESEDRLKAIETKIKNAEKGSHNRQKWIKRKNKLNQKIKNRRRDCLHKLSYDLSNRYDYIFVEDLNMVEMSGSHHLGSATLDNSYAMFLDYLNYKMEERGKKLIKISKWFPSTKTCNVCGFINRNIAMNVKQWDCPVCKTHHDRDINAAINIKNEGLKLV